MKQVHQAMWFAVLSALVGAIATVFAKDVVSGSFITGATWWFISASLWSVIFVLVTGRMTRTWNEFKCNAWKLGGIGFLDACSTILWFGGIYMLGSTITGFLEKAVIPITIFLGVALLKERFNIGEVFSAAVIIIGTIVLGYTPFGINGWIMLPVLGGVFYSFANYLRKRSISSISVSGLVVSRAFIIMMFYLIIALFTGELALPRGEVLGIIIIVPLFTAVIQHLLTTNAYRHLELSKVWLLTSLSPLFVIPMSFLVHQETISSVQALGGFLLLGGPAALILFKKKASPEAVASGKAKSI
ncbi:MAG: DMT family transporter [Nanoarchaeota archaeon]